MKQLSIEYLSTVNSADVITSTHTDKQSDFYTYITIIIIIIIVMSLI